MHVRLLIDGRVVWVKSHVLGKVREATEKKKRKQMWKGRWAEWSHLWLLSLRFLFYLFSKILCLVCVMSGLFWLL